MLLPPPTATTPTTSATASRHSRRHSRRRSRRRRRLRWCWCRSRRLRWCCLVLVLVFRVVIKEARTDGPIRRPRGQVPRRSGAAEPGPLETGSSRDGVLWRRSPSGYGVLRDTESFGIRSPLETESFGRRDPTGLRS